MLLVLSDKLRSIDCRQCQKQIGVGLDRSGKSDLRISHIVTFSRIAAVDLCIECLVALWVVIVLCTSEPASAADVDVSRYAHAVDFAVVMFTVP
jgi:hypothetical protein